MRHGEFESLLPKLSGRAAQLYFHVMGEPCLHPELGLFLDTAHAYGFGVNLTTNGTLLDKHQDTALLKPALRKLSISLHSHTQSKDYELYVEDVIASIKKLRAQRQIIIDLRLWNRQHQGDTGNAWVIKKVHAAFSHRPIDMGEWTGHRGIQFAPDLYVNEAETFEWPDLNCPDRGSTGFCRGLRDQIGILCDGTAVPCCLDAEGILGLGNLFTQSLDEIIESPRARAIYEGFSNRTIAEELCRKCGYRQRFNLE
jgi:hypothetical protein